MKAHGLAESNLPLSLTFDPPDLIERAARGEGWTDAEREHCARIVRDAFEETFLVKRVQSAGSGLIAYGDSFSMETVTFQGSNKKPVLRAFEDLSRSLLQRARERET